MSTRPSTPAQDSGPDSGPESGPGVGMKDPRLARLRASLKVQSGDSPHPAMLALSRQSRGPGRQNRRLAEFLRIARGRLA